MVTGSPGTGIFRLVQREINGVQAEAVVLREGIFRNMRAVKIGRICSRVPLHCGIHITTEGGLGERGLHLAHLFVCARSRGETYYAHCRETYCPFIKLHLVPPMLFGLFLFVVL